MSGNGLIGPSQPPRLWVLIREVVRGKRCCEEPGSAGSAVNLLQIDLGIGAENHTGENAVFRIIGQVRG